MSMYNMLNGVNPLSKILCNILAIDFNSIERFRDSGIDKENKIIWIYTRTGGNNREGYKNKVLTDNINYIKDYDDDYDSTYATFEFKIPEGYDDILNLAEKDRPDWSKILKNLEDKLK